MRQTSSNDHLGTFIVTNKKTPCTDDKYLKSWEDAVKSITEVIGDDKVYIMKVSLARDDCYKDYVIFKTWASITNKEFDGETLNYLLYYYIDYFKWGFSPLNLKKTLSPRSLL